jgi:hypothetical protein
MIQYQPADSGLTLRQAQDEALCMKSRKKALMLSLSKHEGRSARPVAR